jgi:hypothetical protein
MPARSLAYRIRQSYRNKSLRRGDDGVDADQEQKLHLHRRDAQRKRDDNPICRRSDARSMRFGAWCTFIETVINVMNALLSK